MNDMIDKLRDQASEPSTIRVSSLELLNHVLGAHPKRLKHARILLISMLMGCVYAWLIIATTTDARILANGAAYLIPVPIVALYWGMPLILLLLSISFYLFLKRLCRVVAERAFSEGKSINKKDCLCLLNRLGWVCLVRLRDDGLPSRLQGGFSVLLIWWLVPVTLLAFWGRYLPRHEWAGTNLHIGLLVVSVGSGVVFHHLAITALLLKERKSFFWKNIWKDTRVYYYGAVATCSGAIGVIFYFLSFGAIYGIPSHPGPSHVPWEEMLYVKPTSVRRLVPRVFEAIGYSPFANLEEAEVSTKPANWTGQREDEIELVKGVHLKNRNLRYLKASHAFLVNADFQGAALLGADLSEADLRGSNLSGAIFREAYLQGADLRRAVLRDVAFYGAILKKATFQDAELRGATLWGIDLRETNLKNADLREANLSEANLQNVSLRNADLSRADLRRANLRNANLSGANLRNAFLLGADLTDVRGLTREQIASAFINVNTRLPAYLEASTQL